MAIFADIYTMWSREMIRFVRQKARVISSLSMPFLWLVFIGAGFGGSMKMPGFDYQNFIAPGIIGMSLLFTSLFSGLSIIWERQFGFLKEILVAPVSRTSIMLGKTIGGATIALITGLAMYVIAGLMGMLDLTRPIFPSLVFMFMTSVCFVALGLILACRIKNMEVFQALMTFIMMPLMFLSGALFPVNNTPNWMQAASALNPLTYGVDGLRNAILGTSLHTAWTDFGILAAFAIILTLLGAYFFRKAN